MGDNSNGRNSTILPPIQPNRDLPAMGIGGKCKDLVGRDQLRQCIEILLSNDDVLLPENVRFQNELILFSGRLTTLEQKIQVGTIDKSAENEERNKIREGLLKIIQELEPLN